MQIVMSQDNHSVLSLARGQELFSVLSQWSSDHHIHGATLTGLGAADNLELAYYNLANKKYERHSVHEEVEILLLTGNIALLEGTVALHIHGSFGKKDLSMFGGHLFALQISGACEIHVVTFASPLHRSYDAQTGLNLLCNV